MKCFYSLFDKQDQYYPYHKCFSKDVAELDPSKSIYLYEPNSSDNRVIALSSGW